MSLVSLSPGEGGERGTSGQCRCRWFQFQKKVRLASMLGLSGATTEARGRGHHLIVLIVISLLELREPLIAPRHGEDSE